MTTIQEFETTTIPPQDPTRHTHTVIFLHGRGDNTRSFIRALRKSNSSPPFPHTQKHITNQPEPNNPPNR